MEKEFTKLSETDVGITEYTGAELKGFNSILKHRYSDFLVNEIDQSGQVVWIKTSENDNSIKIIEDKPAKIETEEQIDKIINQDFKDILNSKDLEVFREFLVNYINKAISNDAKITIDFIEDKQKRKLLHEMIRKHFNFLNSETLTSSNNSKIIDNDKKIQIFIEKNQNLNKRRRTLPDNNKKYLYFTMLKRNTETVAATNYIARMLKRTGKTICFAGNKDKRGITQQTVSCYSTLPEELINLSRAKFWDRKIEIGNFEFKENELRLGMLKGNQFSVILRFIDIEDDEIDRIVENIKNNGFISYFGLQRFGVGSISTHTIGLFAIKRQFRDVIYGILNTTDVNEILSRNKYVFDNLLENEAAINCLLKELPRFTVENRILSTIKRMGKSAYLNAFKSLNRQLQVLYPHAYQSYIWNRTTSERIKRHGFKLIIGDIVKKRIEIDESNPIENFDDELQLLDEDNQEEQDNNQDNEAKVEVQATDVDKSKIYTINFSL